jgi:ribosomal protein L40E
MRCPGCTAENPEHAKFCLECGAQLGHRCACGAELPGKAKFCLECGKPVSTGPVPPAPDPRSYTPKHLAEKILTSRSALQGERKHPTMVYHRRFPCQILVAAV